MTPYPKITVTLSPDTVKKAIEYYLEKVLLPVTPHLTVTGITEDGYLDGMLYVTLELRTDPSIIRTELTAEQTSHPDEFGCIKVKP